jgi:hypothetical protein
MGRSSSIHPVLCPTIETFVLTDGFAPVQWTPVAKDAVDLPPSQRRSREARQLVSVGETCDFEIRPVAGRLLWLELRRGNGEWVTQALLVAGTALDGFLGPRGKDHQRCCHVGLAAQCSHWIHLRRPPRWHGSGAQRDKGEDDCGRNVCDGVGWADIEEQAF